MDIFKKSFSPIAHPDIEILILGSLPSEKSLQEHEYYAHSHNRFWKVLAAINACSNPMTYQEKIHLLTLHKIGLWDVVYQAKRLGSLDSAIQDESPNDLESFIQNHPKIKTIGFNGKKSEALYDKYFERKQDLRYLSLPSTSPANAGIRFEALCESWKALFRS